MAWRDGASAGVLALVALYALVESARLDAGTVTRPGPGFFPFVLSAALLLTSIALLAQAWRRLRPAAPAAGEGDAGRRPWALAATVVALATYIAIFEWVGFVLATIALLTFLFGALGRYRWPVAIAGSVAVTLASYLVFNTWLQVRLPAGLWGW